MAKERKVISVTQGLDQPIFISAHWGFYSPHSVPIAGQDQQSASIAHSQKLALRKGREHRSWSARNPQGAETALTLWLLLGAKPQALWQDLFFPKPSSAVSTSKPWEPQEGKVLRCSLGGICTSQPRSQGFCAHALHSARLSECAFISPHFKESTDHPTLSYNNCWAIYHFERKSHVTTPRSTRNNVRNSFICD